MPTLTNYHWDDVDDCVMHETNNLGATTVTYTRKPGQYGPLISEKRAGTTFTHHYDAIGSTALLTSDSGTVTDTFAYDAWGVSVARSGTTPTPYQWGGRLGCHSTIYPGMYYVRARLYLASIARWLSEDPIGFFGGRNLYSYSMNSPSLNIDPTGLKPIKARCAIPGCSPAKAKSDYKKLDEMEVSCGQEQEKEFELGGDISADFGFIKVTLTLKGKAKYTCSLKDLVGEGVKTCEFFGYIAIEFCACDPKLTNKKSYLISKVPGTSTQEEMNGTCDKCKFERIKITRTYLAATRHNSGP